MNPGRAAWATYIFLSTQGHRRGEADTTDHAEQVRIARGPLTTFEHQVAEEIILVVACVIAMVIYRRKIT